MSPDLKNELSPGADHARFRSIGPRANGGRKWLEVVCQIALLAATFCLDVVTGAELTVVPLYLIFVSVMAWRHSFTVGVFSSIFAAISWAFADVMGGHQFSSQLVLVENTLARLTSFLLVAYGVGLYRRALETHRDRLRLMEYFMCCCPGCGRMTAAREGWVSAAELFGDGRRPVRYCPTCERRAAK